MQLKKIKLFPQYGTKVAVVPVPENPSVWREATREQLAVLLALMAEPSFSYFSVAEKTGATRRQIDDAIQYWIGAGVIAMQQEPSSSCGDSDRSAAQDGKTTQSACTLERAAELPHYNTDEAARYLEKNPGATSLIDCCQQELGRIFNTSESEIIIGMLDYLSLDPEYILLLCAHNAKRGRKSLRYIEKMAISLHDAGVSTYEQLELYLKKEDAANDAEHSLRDLFGIGKRALVKREREAFFRWVSEWEMPLDVITYAYEITINRTREPSIPYTNAILEKWNSEGLRTLEDVQHREAERSRAQSAPGTAGGSFETDDFFEAALKRSYDRNS